MIISISGRLQSGKDTASEFIQEFAPAYEWQVKKWAGKLKQIASTLTNIPLSKWEDNEFKKSILPAPWSNFTGRSFLQKLGTDALRNSFDQEVWTKSLMSEYVVNTIAVGSNEFDIVEVDIEPNWIITDTRFPNELQAIKEKGALLIKVVRPEAEVTGGHESETQLDSYMDWDYIIENTGTLQDLRDEVKRILIQEKLI